MTESEKSAGVCADRWSCLQFSKPVGGEGRLAPVPRLLTSMPK